jgi:xeroderma pigmentosum group C-complementing protein
MSFDWNLSSDDEEDLEEFLSKHNHRHSIASRTAENDHDDEPQLRVLPSGERESSSSSSFIPSSQPKNQTIVTPSSSSSMVVTENSSVNRRPWTLTSTLDTNRYENELKGCDEDENEDDDEVDWEDVEEMVERSDDNDKNASMPLRPVELDLDESPTAKQPRDPQSTKKLRRRKRFRVDALPPNLQTILWNLHRSHLLSLTCHAVFVSSLSSSDDEILAIAHSLIPDEFGETPTITSKARDDHYPTLSQLHSFLQWFWAFTNHVEQRRQQRQLCNWAAGAPRTNRPRRKGRRTQMAVPNDPYLPSQPLLITTHRRDRLLSYMSYLSKTNDENPQLADRDQNGIFHEQERNLLQIDLLIAMARSLRWRTRFVQAMDPISPDLHVEHPILVGIRNIFSSLASSKAKKQKTTHETGKGKREPDDISYLEDQKVDTSTTMGWVEILCFDPKVKCQHRWIHVDPIHQLVDQPSQVETLLPAQSAAITKSRFTPPRNKPNHKRSALAYAVAVEHGLSFLEDTTRNVHHQYRRVRLTDVTPRYADSWIATLKKRGITQTGKKNGFLKEVEENNWWSKTLHAINESWKVSFQCAQSDVRPSGINEHEAINVDEDDDRKPAAVNHNPLDKLIDHEREELNQCSKNEAIPTSKAAFRTHPLYVIPSELGKSEVLHPDASKRVVGVFKGQLVYRRSDVSTALTAKKWLYEGREVLETELAKPILRVKARKIPASTSFKALKSYGVGVSNEGSEDQRKRDIAVASKPLEDGMEDLYAHWQTETWSPPWVGPTDDIPVNEYRNVELALLNPGLVHIDQRGIATVAKKLGIPYAPCLLGFEGHGGNRTPTIRGIVVHQHNEQLVREAGMEVTSHAMQQEHDDRRKAIHLRWKRLMVGLLTKARVEREYGDDEE